MFNDHLISNVRTGAPLPDGLLGAMIAAEVVKRTPADKDGPLPAFRRMVQARHDSVLAQGVTEGRVRRDSFQTNTGLFLARDLEHVYDDVLREPFPAPNAFSLFFQDGSVPVGKKSHTVRRLYQTGEAQWYKGGSAVKRVAMNQQEQTFPVRYAVDSFGYSIFERMSATAASMDIHGEEMRTARDVLAQFVNRALWFGAPQVNLHGIVDYPWLPKKAIATDFTFDSDPRDVLHELNRLANFPREKSKTTLQSDRMATTPRVRDFLFETPWSPLAADGKSIGEKFVGAHARIKSIEEAWELEGVGPAGEDGILVYQSGRNGVAVVLPGGPFNALPPQERAYDLEVFCYTGCGGVIMRNVGGNVLGLVTAPSV